MIKYLIIGDDARQENLAKLFWTISFRETEKDLKKQIKNSNVIVTPICTANENIILNLKKYAKKGTKIFGGGFQTDFEEIMKQKKCSVYDITKDPDFAEKNAIPIVFKILPRNYLPNKKTALCSLIMAVYIFSIRACQLSLYPFRLYFNLKSVGIPFRLISTM